VNDVLYRWNARAVKISEDLRMSQFDLIEMPSSNESIRVGENMGKEKGELVREQEAHLPLTLDNLSQNIFWQTLSPSLSAGVQEFSVLLVSFHLQRHMGNFLIQVYGPCILLVVLSWVSFWLNREATADRYELILINTFSSHEFTSQSLAWHHDRAHDDIPRAGGTNRFT
jgi:gamma-aminobutyric acid receptor subunit alpha